MPMQFKYMSPWKERKTPQTTPAEGRITRPTLGEGRRCVFGGWLPACDGYAAVAQVVLIGSRPWVMRMLSTYRFLSTYIVLRKLGLDCNKAGPRAASLNRTYGPDCSRGWTQRKSFHLVLLYHTRVLEQPKDRHTTLSSFTVLPLFPRIPRATTPSHWWRLLLVTGAGRFLRNPKTNLN